MNNGMLAVARKLSGYKLLETIESKYNGKVEVVREFGEIRVMTGGITQSGKPLAMVWEKVVDSVQRIGYRVNNVLIMGLGAGTLAKMVSKKFPRAKIIGVEIDPEMVRIGRKYFGLGEIDNLEIVIDDAYKFCFDDSNHRSRYDLIFVDLYKGSGVPEKLDSVGYFGQLVKLVAPEGKLFVNRLYFDEVTKSKAQETIERLKQIKGIELKLMRTFTNLVIEVKLSV